MIQANPYHVVRDDRTDKAKLLLRLQDSNRCLAITLSMEQARYISAEMNGLATHHCSHHHMLGAIANAFDTTIVSMNLREMGNGPIVGALRLESTHRTIEVEVDVAAGLSFAIHQGIPVFVAGEHFKSEGSPSSAHLPAETPDSSEIPAAFREVIEGIEGIDTPPNHNHEETGWGWGIAA